LSRPTKIFDGKSVSGYFRVGEAVKVEGLPISCARLEKMDVRANMGQNRLDPMPDGAGEGSDGLKD